jgi:hypothetical protein
MADNAGAMNDNLRSVALLRPIASPSSEVIEAPERLVARLRAPADSSTLVADSPAESSAPADVDAMTPDPFWGDPSTIPAAKSVWMFTFVT